MTNEFGFHGYIDLLEIGDNEREAGGKIAKVIFNEGDLSPMPVRVKCLKGYKKCRFLGADRCNIPFGTTDTSVNRGYSLCGRFPAVIKKLPETLKPRTP